MQTWKVVWSWEGNNADGIIAGDAGTMLFANNDASNVTKTLFGIVFYGTWGTVSARNRVIAIPTIAQGYTGRAKWRASPRRSPTPERNARESVGAKNGR